MGKWTDSTGEKKRKALQRVIVPVLINEENLERLELAIGEFPDSFTGEVTNISNASGLVDVTVTYTARGANITDVKRALERVEIPFVTKRPKTEKLED